MALGAKTALVVHAVFLAGLSLGREELWATRFGPDNVKAYNLVVACNLVADVFLAGLLGSPTAALAGALSFSLALERENEALGDYSTRSVTLVAAVLCLIDAGVLATRLSGGTKSKV